MPEKIKRMDIKEFREQGYLLELNRKFLHPLGLALEVIIRDDGKEDLGGVWDYRYDPEGMLFAATTMADKNNVIRSNRIKDEYKKKAAVRKEKYGWAIQPFILE